ncbi:MAG TPA: hypothetical protein VF334_13000 [Polyangia bacterium]
MQRALATVARAAVALAAAALAAGCSSATAVDVTIQLGGDVAAHASELATLALHVDGDATPFDRTLDVHGKFGSGKETLQYLPGVTAGTLAFTVTLADGNGTALGRGSASTPLKAHGSIALVIPVGAELADGGGDDLAGADLSVGPDLSMPACSRITVSTLAGTGASGHMDGAGNVAQFQMLEGITVDPNGTLWLAEAANVRKVLADGTTSTFATGFSQARRIARSNVGDFDVADSTNDMLKHVTSTGTVSTDFALGGIVTVADSPTDGTSYVWDTQTSNLSTTNASNMVVTFSGSGPGFMDGAAGAAKFGNVPDLVFDASGILWVADAGNFRIRRVASDGSVTTLAGSTQGSVDGTGSAAQFNALLGITVDNATHNLYVTDGTTIRVVTPAGAVSTLVGTTSGFVDGDGCVARFGALKGITYFAGALYAVDVERVRKIVLP